MRRVYLYCLVIIILLTVTIAKVWFVYVNNSKPFRNVETIAWKSITVSYCIGDGVKVTKKKQTISDTPTLNQLRALFANHSWDYAYLHFASQWNKIIILLENGEYEAFVAGQRKLCYYAKFRNAVFINTGQEFEEYLTQVLQSNETETVHLFYDFQYEVINQEPMLIPDDNKWREEKYLGEETETSY